MNRGGSYFEPEESWCFGVVMFDRLKMVMFRKIRGFDESRFDD
jgi:hypothetical protein